MNVVIETGGKQYIVSPGSRIKVEKLPVLDNGEVLFERVLLLTDDNGVVITDRNRLAQIKVKGRLIQTGRGKKILVFKKKTKKDYKKAQGHRQPYSLVEIEEIFA